MCLYQSVGESSDHAAGEIQCRLTGLIKENGKGRGQDQGEGPDYEQRQRQESGSGRRTRNKGKVKEKVREKARLRRGLSPGLKWIRRCNHVDVNI